ncbi:MAG TPA: hypothetical protein VJR27_01550 [Candidatus Saccharimonadales bacterium]|nr:hypothetical protein [Candidatus Saccharimonadales bacterium]
MFNVHHFEVSIPTDTLAVYIDDGAPPEDKGFVESVGAAPFDYDHVAANPELQVSFAPPLAPEAKARTFSPEAIAGAMNVAEVAIRWTTEPSKDYGKLDVEHAWISLDGQSWDRPTLNAFLDAIGRLAKQHTV